MIQRLELKNGLKLLVEKRPSKSVSLLLVVNFGSNDEDKKENGIAHFIEHLVFNGPKGMTKKALSASIEGIGGELNGATSNNFTVYYIQVLGKHFETALKTLNAMVFRPEFTKKDVQFEKGIILSEIGHSKDSPISYTFDLMQEELFPDHPYGKTILGLKKTVEGMEVKNVKAYYQRFYAPNNMMVAAVGNLTEKQINKLKKVFGKPKKRPVDKARHHIPPNKHREKVVVRDFKQAHMGLGWKVMPSTDKDVYTMHVISAILGGGLSSRLMQEIREKRGLAYVVQTNFDPMKEYGFFGVYVGTDEKKVEQVKKIIFTEFKKLKETRVASKELLQAKQLLEGRTFLKSEDSLEAGKNLLTLELYGEKDAHSFMKKIFDVSVDDVKRVARKYLNERDYALVLLRPEPQVIETKEREEIKPLE